ncbi:MAG: ACT domain-containing protein [Bacilli bacterium]
MATELTYEAGVACLALLGVSSCAKTLVGAFSVLAAEHIPVLMIAYSETATGHDISIALKEAYAARAYRAFHSVADQLSYQTLVEETGLARISLSGVGMVSNPGVASRMFIALQDVRATVRMLSTSEMKISCVIEGRLLHRAVRSVGKAFSVP